MTRRLQAIALLALSITAAVPAQASARGSGGSTGLGLILGDPTGISGKFWQDGSHAIDAGLAWSFSDYFLVFGDYLWHFPGTFGRKSDFVAHLTPYVGVGGVLVFGSSKGPFGKSSTGFGVRIPLGLEWKPSTAPLGVFLEVVPGLALAPSTGGFVQGGIGIRFYF